MMSVPREKISEDKHGFIERVIDRFGPDPRTVFLILFPAGPRLGNCFLFPAPLILNK